MRNLSSDLMVEILNRQMGTQSSKDVIRALLHHQTRMRVHTHNPQIKGEISLSQHMYHLPQ